MSRVLELDQEIRKSFSVLYRIMLISYALLLIFFSSDNFFSREYYLAGCGAYLIIYLVFKKRHSVVRLINDYCLIAFILYEKNFTPAIIVFCLLPFFNSPNHSGENRRPWLIYILTVAIFLLLVDFKIDSFRNLIRVAVPFLFPLAINAIELIRSQILKKNEAYNAAVDSYFESGFELGKTYKILRKISDLLNMDNLVSFTTSRILVFKERSQKFYLLSSSKFVKSYSISRRKQFLERLHREKIVLDNPITIDQKIYNKTVSFIYAGKNYNLVFLLITEKLYVSYLYNTFLQSVFNRTAKAIIFDDKIDEEHAKYVDSIKNKTLFIDEVETSMHYIKGRLMPMYNFIPMIDDYMGSTEEEQMKTRGIFEREKSKIQTDLNDIIDKAISLNEKSKSTYLSFEFDKVKVKKVIALVRKLWFNYLDKERFIFKLSSGFETDYSVRIFEDGIILLFSNWISNMHRHNNGSVRVLYYSESNKTFNIEFTNNYREEATDQVKEFVTDFNSNVRNEILRKKTRGIIDMKTQLEKMELKYSLVENNGLVKFTVSFELEESESSGI